MGLLSSFAGEKKSTASVAKDRLQMILTRKRNGNNSRPSYMPDLQKELLAVISKYVSVDVALPVTIPCARVAEKETEANCYQSGNESHQTNRYRPSERGYDGSNQSD